jgi:DNA-binding NarL/FixJ family response regulator
VTIRVVLAEPEPSRREAMRVWLSDEARLDVVATSDDVPSTLLQATRVGADVVLVTPRFPTPLSDFCSDLQAVDCPPRTLFLDDRADDGMLLDVIEAGVDGYVSDVVNVVDAIAALARGESVIPPTMLGPLLRRLIQRRREASQVAEQLLHLTPRERQVLSLLVDGLDQGAISDALYISPETARTHIQRIMRKLGVHSRADVAALVSRTGLAERIERMVERSTS